MGEWSIHTHTQTLKGEFMAIMFVTGVPGSGKTLYILQRFIIPALKKGKTVYHNIEGLEEKKMLIASYWDDVDPIHVSSRLIEFPEDQIKTFYEWIATKDRDYAINCLVVVDEVQNIYSARDYQANHNKAVIPYLTTHRHFGHDVIFCTQHQDNVDVAVRRMTDTTFLITNNKNFGSKKSCRVATYVRDRVDMPPAHVNPVYPYDARIFAVYKSYQGEDVQEKKIAIKWWMSPKLITVMLILAFCVSMFTYNQLYGSGFLRTGRKAVGKEQISESVIQKEKLNEEKSKCAIGQRIGSSGLESYVKESGWESGLLPLCQ